MSIADLYDEDFYLWTQAQAEALRAEGRRKGASNALDYENLAEEVESLGKSDLRECLSRTQTIIEHLMKLASGQQPAPRAGWKVTVLTQRTRLDLVLTKSLRAKVSARLRKLHAQARKIAEAALAAEEPGAPPIDSALSWSLKQILGEEDDPVA
jgi:hypothetical protein